MAMRSCHTNLVILSIILIIHLIGLACGTSILASVAKNVEQNVMRPKKSLEQQLQLSSTTLPGLEVYEDYTSDEVEYDQTQEESDDDQETKNQKPRDYSPFEGSSSISSGGPFLDTSVFGNTDETFFEFANRRVQELEDKNRLKFDRAIQKCSASSGLNNNNNNKQDGKPLPVRVEETCMVGSLNFDNFFARTSDRLFLYDQNTIGLISSHESALKLYHFNAAQRTLAHWRTKHFKNEIPHDACVDKSKAIYIVFPDSNKIAKFIITATSGSQHGASQGGQSRSAMPSFKTGLNSSSLNAITGGSKHYVLRELMSIKDTEFNPSTIACSNDLLYVGERPHNIIRVYDKLLRLVRIIHLKNVVVSSHRALAVNQNARVMLDGSDSLALFNPPTSVSKRSSLDQQQQTPLTSAAAAASKNRKRGIKARLNVCHVYQSIGCLEDVKLVAHSSTRSSIFLVDSCENEVKEFDYRREESSSSSSSTIKNNDTSNSTINPPTVSWLKRLRIENGIPISVVGNELGYLFVLTDLPRKILVLNQKECGRTSGL